MISDPSADRATASYWLVALIPLAAFAVYWNSLSAPFIFDDYAAIPQNPTIQHLWPLSGPLQPPDNGSGVTGRPVINLSLAINYAIGGLNERGYHLGNILLHAIAGLTLFGLIRRTLLQPALIDAYDKAATPLALVIALLWTVHPLQTETVTCVIQRTEALMGLFYLLTLYAFVRSVENSPFPAESLGPAEPPTGIEPALTPVEREPLRLRRGWQVVSVVSCLLGMASKEVMVSAPLMVFLYDCIFVSGSWREAWRRHGTYYVALATTWILLAWLVIGSGGERGGTVSLRSNVSPWTYLLTQSDALTRYLKLSFWPRPLVLDYGIATQTSLAVVLQESLIVVSLLGGTIVAFRRHAATGFAGAWFFLILAPSSSVLPLLTQTMAEHRMYLSLAAVLSVMVLAAYRWASRWTLPGACIVILGFSMMTYFRNEDYRSKLGIWEDTVRKQPDNPRAWYNLGQELFAANKIHEALDAFNESLQRDENQGRAQAGLAAALDVAGRPDEALPHARAGVLLAPTYTSAHVTLGLVLTHLGHPQEALRSFQKALEIKEEPMSAFHAGNTLFQLRRFGEAEYYYRKSITGNSAMATAHYNLAVTLATLHREREAVPEFEETLRLQPDLPKAREALDQIRKRLLPAAVAPVEVTVPHVGR